MQTRECDVPLLTYEVIPRTCMPPVLDRTSGRGDSNYPYPSYLSNHSQPVRKVYRGVEIENESLRVTVLPDLGGRIYQIEDVETGGAYLHENRCVRPVRIPPRWNFISLGIELNFPYTHSPTGNDPVGYELIRDDDAGMVGVAVGEQERQWGLSWRADVRLYRGYRGVVVAVRGWNDTKVRREVQWWSNAAQPSGGDVEFVFPDEPIVAHIESEEKGTWPNFNGTDLRWLRNYDRMVGTFHHPSNADWFGIYHHSREWGLLHLADPDRLPGKKLWSFGHTGTTSDWTLTMTRDGGPSCEIQSGVPGLQDQFLELGPGDDFASAETWQPVDDRSELDEGRRPCFADIEKSVGGINDAPRILPPAASHVPGFLWRELLDTWRRDDESCLGDLEKRLGDEEAGWPPRGYPDLALALAWADDLRPHFILWKFMRGIHACAMEEWDTAEQLLLDVVESENGNNHWRRGGNPRDIARVLRAKVRSNGTMETDQAISAIVETVGSLRDGSLLEEADHLLRDQERTSARRKLLKSWPENDFRKQEIAASIEIDDGNPRQSLEILLSTPWEKHHCRHRRTELWRQARMLLGEPTEPVPALLQEDPYIVSG